MLEIAPLAPFAQGVGVPYAWRHHSWLPSVQRDPVSPGSVTTPGLGSLRIAYFRGFRVQNATLLESYPCKWAAKTTLESHPCKKMGGHPPTVAFLVPSRARTMSCKIRTYTRSTSKPRKICSCEIIRLKPPLESTLPGKPAWGPLPDWAFSS
jgi:hypothetical protein